MRSALENRLVINRESRSVLARENEGKHSTALLITNRRIGTGNDLESHVVPAFIRHRGPFSGR